MNGEDQFESRLKQQTLTSVPDEWREQILNKASQVRCSSPDNEVLTSHATGKRFNLRVATSAATRVFSQLLWPSGKAWAGLAAIWVAIIGFIVISGDSDENRVASRPERSSPLVQELLREQSRLFVELSDGTDQGEAIPMRRDDRGPRSGCDVAWREV